MAEELKFKVVLLGEGSVGKTSIVNCYINKSFNPKHVTTIQASFLSKQLVANGKRTKLAIWDTAGQERFHALGPIYYRDSHGAVLVYDITDEDSFIKVTNWVKELRKMLGKDVCLAIVGNKIDMERSRTVSQEEAESYAASVGARHFSTSAKLNKGVDQLFQALAEMMVTVHEKKPGSTRRPRPGPSSGGTGAGTASAGGAGSARRRRGEDLLVDFENSQAAAGNEGCAC